MYRLMKVSGAMAVLRVLAASLAALLFALKARIWAALCCAVALVSLLVGRKFEKSDLATVRGRRMSRAANVISVAVLLLGICLP